MKITIFVDNVAPYRMGWADELGKLCDVTIVYVKDKDAERNSSWLVKKSKYAKMVKLPAVIIKNHAISFAVIKYIRENTSDIIIFSGYGTIPNLVGMMYLTVRKKPYFINVDGVRIGHKEQLLAKLFKKIVFNSHSFFLCGSDYSKQYIMSYGISKEKICVHNFTSLYRHDLISGLPKDKEKSEYKKQLGLKDIPMAIAVGRFVKLKQFDLLIEAFEKLDENNQLLLVGEGEEQTTYETLIKEKELMNVHIISFQDFSMLKKYY